MFTDVDFTIRRLAWVFGFGMTTNIEEMNKELSLMSKESIERKRVLAEVKLAKVMLLTYNKDLGKIINEELSKPIKDNLRIASLKFSIGMIEFKLTQIRDILNSYNYEISA